MSYGLFSYLIFACFDKSLISFELTNRETFCSISFKDMKSFVFRPIFLSWRNTVFSSNISSESFNMNNYKTTNISQKNRQLWNIIARHQKQQVTVSETQT